MSLDLAFVATVGTRSGSNFLARMLVLHPEVARPDGWWDWRGLSAWPSLQVFVEAQATDRRGRMTADRVSGAIGRALLDEFRADVPPDDRGARWLLHKVPSAAGLDGFRPLFGDAARLVLLVRDGRDVVHSNLAAASRSGAHVVARSARRWAANARAIRTYPGDHVLVRYEDLVADPRPGLRAVAAHLGLDAPDEWLDACVSLPVRGSTHLRADGAERSGPALYAEVESTAAFQPIGRWRTTWSAGDRLAFTAAAGAELRRHGYR